MPKKNTDYFSMIAGLVNYSYDAAVYLCDSLKSFDFDALPEHKEKLHKIEHSADINKHEIMKQLAREFITPIDREDIMRLAEEIDNVTDMVEDVLIKIYMYNVSQIPAEAVRMAEVIVRCCSALRDMLTEFHNFRKSQTINSLIIEINRLEEESDRLYTESMRTLYRELPSGGQNAAMCLIWSDVFGSLENCCDACEHVSDVVEQVIMKNV